MILMDFYRSTRYGASDSLRSGHLFLAQNDLKGSDGLRTGLARRLTLVELQKSTRFAGTPKSIIIAL